MKPLHCTLHCNGANIDLVNNRVRIVQTLDYEAKTKEDLFGDVKTYHSEPEIPITSSLSVELQNHRSRQNDTNLGIKISISMT